MYYKVKLKVSVFAQSNVIADQAEFGLKTGIGALEFFESYFDIPYPLTKQGKFLKLRLFND